MRSAPWERSQDKSPLPPLQAYSYSQNLMSITAEDKQAITELCYRFDSLINQVPPARPPCQCLTAHGGRRRRRSALPPAGMPRLRTRLLLTPAVPPPRMQGRQEDLASCFTDNATVQHPKGIVQGTQALLAYFKAVEPMARGNRHLTLNMVIEPTGAPGRTILGSLRRAGPSRGRWSSCRRTGLTPPPPPGVAGAAAGGLDSPPPPNTPPPARRSPDRDRDSVPAAAQGVKPTPASGQWYDPGRGGFSCWLLLAPAPPPQGRAAPRQDAAVCTATPGVQGDAAAAVSLGSTDGSPVSQAAGRLSSGSLG